MGTKENLKENLKLIKLSDEIRKYISSIFSTGDANKYYEFISAEPVTYIRKKKSTNEESLLNKLSKNNISLEKINEVKDAYKVNSGSEWTGKTPEFILGQYYIQSLSSMIPPLILNPKENDKVLDLCAAPGSKTTQIADLMNNKGTLIANESNLDRIKMLVHNIDKLNIINTGVICSRGEWLNKYYQNYFDKILVDAPCSALGVVQKRGEVSNWWSINRLANLTKIQLMLLTAAIKMVKPGGEIVYSTCTLTVEENELIINHVLKKHPVEVVEIQLPIKSHEAITSYKGELLNKEINKARRILPWEVNSEGFFIIKLRKVSDTKSSKNIAFNNGKIKLLSHNEIASLLYDITELFGIRKNIWQEFKFLIKGNDIFFMDKNWRDSNPDIFTRIGTRFGLIDKNNKAHLHTFAAQFLGDEINKNTFQLQDENQLKEYLNGGIIKTDIKSNGQKVIKFKNYVLGTAIQLENRLKSQFPKSKRVSEIKIAS